MYTALAIVIGFLVVFPLFWCFVCLLLAKFGGWSAMAAEVRATETPRGALSRMQSGKVGIVRYRHVLTIGVQDDGLYLAVFPLFRAGHPPVFVPWSQVSVIRRRKQLFGDFIEATVGRPSRATIQLPSHVFRVRGSASSPVHDFQAADSLEMPDIVRH